MLTHIYLLLGCALPSFLCPSVSEVLPSTVYPLSLYPPCKSRQWDEPGKTSRLTLVTDAGAPDGATSTATPVGRAHRWHWRYCCLYVCNPRSLSLFRARTRVACVHGEILLCSEPYCQLFIRRERTRPKTHKIDTDVAHFTDAHIGRGESAAPAKAHLVLSESMTVSTLIPPRRSPTTTSIPKRRSKAPLLALLSPWLLQLFV